MSRGSSEANTPGWRTKHNAGTLEECVNAPLMEFRAIESRADPRCSPPPGARRFLDGPPAAGHGGPGSRDVTGRRFRAPNTGLGERRVQGGARSR